MAKWQDEHRDWHRKCAFAMASGFVYESVYTRSAMIIADFFGSNSNSRNINDLVNLHWFYRQGHQDAL